MEDVNGGQSSNPGVKRRQRFREVDDMALLREVVGQNPFKNNRSWATISEKVFVLTGKQFSIRTLREHLDLLIRLWLKKMEFLKNRSGIEETYYNDHDHLCQTIHEHMLEFRGKQENRTKKKREIIIGKQEEGLCTDRLNTKKLNEEDLPECVEEVIIKSDHDYSNETSCESHTESTELLGMLYSDELKDPNVNAYSTESTSEDYTLERISEMCPTLPYPNKKRKRKFSVRCRGLEHIKEYGEKQLQIKVKQLKLQERKLILEEKRISLEEQKFEMDKKKYTLEEFEQKKRIELLEQMLQLQKDHRKELSAIIERQEKLISLLITKRSVRDS